MSGGVAIANRNLQQTETAKACEGTAQGCVAISWQDLDRRATPDPSQKPSTTKAGLQAVETGPIEIRDQITKAIYVDDGAAQSIVLFDDARAGNRCA